MNELNALELKLLDGLIKKYPKLKFHLDFLKVSERKITGVGLYVNFEYVNPKIDFEDINVLFSNEENIEIQKLKHGIGYVIDVTDGKILYIEFITYGENWDGKFDEYKIIKNSGYSNL
ncbi:hypothetical protein [Halpernia frigidisoli]|uniref:Uncharacterized protein n=1 Tax=Halpernia frigidisoli TaxID=1125876 RepID=A0A1I3DC16_9FLAO|nr:hypothetical protein [Halpernia frigidisoli]SFH84302.1 hypothetical protein SAMN05443292_0374 [Halpernia frigidisoli]